MSDIVIEAHDLRRTFKAKQTKKGSPAIVEAVKSVNLQVRVGEIFGFLGPNGAGKSTTLRVLTTLIPPTSGQVRVAGYDVLKQPGEVRKRIGYVSQAGGTDSAATGRENLILQARLYGLGSREATQRANELVVALELEAIADRQAKTYSGGQRRRLDLALGMVHRPTLLFLDEPTTGLDPQSRAHLWEEVRKLRTQGTTLFLTTHYLEEADALVDRLAIIDDGRIVAEGTPNSLKQQIAGDVVTLGLDAHNGQLQKAQTLLREQAFVREVHPGEEAIQLYVERGEESLPAILRLMDGVGLSVRTVALARPSLDDVFLRKTGRSLREVSQ